MMVHKVDAVKQVLKKKEITVKLWVYILAISEDLSLFMNTVLVVH